MSANRPFERPGTTNPLFAGRDGDTAPQPRVEEPVRRRPVQMDTPRPSRPSLWDTFRRNYHTGRLNFRRIPRMNHNNSNAPRPSATRKIGFGDLSIVLKGAVVAAFISAFSIFVWIPAVLNDFTDKMVTHGSKAKFDYFGIDLDFLPSLPDGFWTSWYMIGVYVIVTAVIMNRRNKRNQTPANHH